MKIEAWQRKAARRYRRKPTLRLAIAVLLSVWALRIARHRKVCQPVLAVVGVALAIVAIMSAAIVGRHAFDRAFYPAPTCAASAARQLPASLVRSVNAIEANRDIASPDSNAFTTDLMTRQVPGGVMTAFANFDPEYCGFDGNINELPDPGADGITGNPVEEKDYVVLYVNGHPTQYDPNGVCISNSVPTVRMIRGVIVMTLRCDRVYANSTWTQENPKL